MNAVILAFDIPGPAVPWQRTATLDGRRLTPASQRAYQRHVKACAALTSVPGWPLDARYKVEIVYVPQDARRRDIDNIAKTILDALNGTAWADDAQVDELRVRREPPTPNEPSVFVMVTATKAAEVAAKVPKIRSPRTTRRVEGSGV